ncbi:MAG: hypothetical protein ACUVX1_06120 [Chloroflexota bacterium]
MTSKEEIFANPAVTATREVGHRLEDDIYVWSQGLAFHNHNLLSGLNDNVADPSVREAILKDVWTFFRSVGLDRVNRVLGVEERPDIDKINKTLADMLSNQEHSAILGAGDYIEEAFVNWVRAFAIYDFAAYTYLEKHLGAKEAIRIYMGLWETFALAPMEQRKNEFGIKDASDVSMDVLGRLSRVYWESIGTPYRVTKDTEDVHEAEVLVCPYWENMRALLGESKARSMTLKTEAITSCNYYDAILKALGVFDKYTFTMDKFACCGDDCCRVRFERRGQR